MLSVRFQRKQFQSFAIAAASGILLLLINRPVPVCAGGFGIAEIGVRRTAMGAVVGRPDEPSAVFHNPAGLVLQPGVHLYLSMGLARISTEFFLQPWEQSENYIDAPVDADGYYPSTKPDRAFGIIPMLTATYEVLPGKLFAAASFYVSNATGSKFEDDSIARYHLKDGYIVSPLASLSVAGQINKYLALGASGGIMEVRIHGSRDVFPILEGTDLSRLLGSASTLTFDGKARVPSWNAGALVTPTDKISAGLTVIGRAKPTLVGPVDLDLGADVGGGTFYGEQKTELLMPWTVLAGVNVDVHPQVEVGTEVRYFRYREYKEQVIDVDGLQLIDMLVTPKNFRDSWAFSGGARVHGLAFSPRLEMMLGFHYDRTPAPANTLTLDQLSFTHVALHSGARYSIGKYRLGASYLRQQYLMPTVTDSISTPPSNFKGNAVNNIFTVSMEVSFGAPSKEAGRHE